MRLYPIIINTDDFEYRFECHPCDIPIEENAVATDDPDADREVENWIRSELGAGNDWAWCDVRCVVSWRGIEGEHWLCACSYSDRADFENGDYAEDVKAEARTDMLRRLGVSCDHSDAGSFAAQRVAERECGCKP